MSMNPKQLRILIGDVLRAINLHSNDAVELLMLTAAQETHCGKYIEQVRGPALGIFQMEPFTHDDIVNDFLQKRPYLRRQLGMFTFEYPGSEDIKELNQRANLPYQIVMARVFYLRIPKALPDHKDLKAMAEYYKKYWNTHLGKATVAEAMHNYTKYAIG